MRQRRWTLFSIFSASTAVLTTVVALQVPAAGAATPLTVAQAIAQQSGATGTVRGYVVGQPTATHTVVRSNHPSDYALAIADTAAETGTTRMIYVQIGTAHRSGYGLKSNPSLLGTRIDVTGRLSAYFSHPGLTATTGFATVGGGTPPSTTTAVPPTSVPGGGNGDYDDTYYADALGRTGPALESALHTIISAGVTKLSYDAVWEALKNTDQDPANSADVVLLYSGRSQSKSANGGGADQWNREHVWAKSHGNFGTATGVGTDIHHLRPEDVSVNSARGDKDFDNGGSAVSECSGCLSDADSFEPRAAVKGDVARMIFYMSVRYEGGDGWADLEVNDSTSNGSNPNIGKVSVLKQWNAQDPPDAFERRRNQVIFDSYQRNRNPFIDHPEWVSAIWG